MTKVQIGRQSGKMGKQVANTDIAFAVLSKLRNVFRYRIVETNLALLDQLHYGGRSRDHLG